MNGSIYALTADAAGNLYTAGTLSTWTKPERQLRRPLRRSGVHAMVPVAVPGITRSIASDGTKVYIGSDGENIGSDPKADHIAKWNGSASTRSARTPPTATAGFR